MPLFRASEMFNKQAARRKDGILLVISSQKENEETQDTENLSTVAIGYSVFAGQINQSRGSEQILQRLRSAVDDIKKWRSNIDKLC